MPAIGMERFSNNAQTTLAEAIGPGDTTITVDDPSRFPAAGIFRIIIDQEIILVTGRSGAIFTIVRGTENTEALAHFQGVAVIHILTKESLLNTFETNDIANVRLSYDANNPLPIAASGNTLYVHPYKGNRVTLFDTVESNWKVCPVAAPIAVTLPTTPSGLYDVFLYYDMPTLSVKAELTKWQDLSTRVGASGIIDQDGVLVRNDNRTRRYIGTLLTTDTSLGGPGLDNQRRRFLWNLYNQEEKELYLAFNFPTYTTSGTNGGRPINNDINNRLEFVVGVDRRCRVAAEVSVPVFQQSTYGTTYAYTTGFGINSFAAINCRLNLPSFSYYGIMPAFGKHQDRPVAGYHIWYAMEAWNMSVSVYSVGTNPAYQSGVYGTIMA